MTVQYSTTLRDNQQNQIESTIGTTPKFQVRSGAQPANCAASDSGSLLCEMTLPSDWLTASSLGVVTKNGTWNGTGAADGVAGHFRIKDSAGTTCHIQGSITESGGGGDAIIDNINVGSGQTVTVTTFQSTRGNA
jgi:hypothetical protein